MSEQCVVRKLVQAFAVHFFARRMQANTVTEMGKAKEFVNREPAQNAIAQRFGNDARITRQIIRALPAVPTAMLLVRGLGHFPVIAGYPRLNPGFKQRVNQTAVKIEPLVINRTSPSGMIRGQATDNRYALMPRSFINLMSSL
jgi:hypothetical protein